MKSKVVIIGAGQAGGRVAVNLRANDFGGEIVLIGEEPHPPYKRPPLSKRVLQGKAEVEDGYLAPSADYADKAIDLRLNCRVTDIDLDDQQVRLHDGSSEHYDHLVFATGGIARTLPLPGAELDNVFVLRTAASAVRIKSGLLPNRHIAIVGGGFIGLEVAASARALGCRVTVLEAQDRLLARSLPSEVADAVVEVHRAEGVDIRTDVRITGFAGEDKIQGIAIDGSDPLPVDLAVIGIGIIPADTLAQTAGIDVDNGILTDEYGKTSVPNTWAVGDCARAKLPRYGAQIRLESFQNADKQAASAAANIAGEQTMYDPVPFLWSDQYSRILQTAGIPTLGNSHILRGSVADQNLVCFSLKDRQLIGVTGWGKGALIAKDVRFSQMLMEKGKSPTPDQLADPEVNIKDLLAG